MKGKIEKQVSNLPSESGVYLFRNREGRVIYVGKALNLDKRVRSYFQESKNLGKKTRKLVSQIERIDIQKTDSEIGALVLEADLIKRLKPKYNRRWKDDKTYPLLEITKETFPRVRITRTKKEEAHYFGPFPKLKVREIKKAVRRMFPFRDCSRAKFERYKKLGRGCLYQDMGLCPAPCVGGVSEQEYEKKIGGLKRFLKGKGKKVIKELKENMEKASEARKFEKAARLRDRISHLKRARLGAISSYFEAGVNLPQDRRRKETRALKEVLNLGDMPERIEAYDVSNIGGEAQAGSMVVFEKGWAEKSHYRRFKIRTVKRPDDTASMKEVLDRRLSYLAGKETDDPSFQSEPDLVLVDGGKGQLNAAREVMEKKDLEIPVAGLAKKEETLFFPGEEGKEIKKDDLSGRKKEPALRLVQRIRDESHRFALSYHRKLRESRNLG